MNIFADIQFYCIESPLFIGPFSLVYRRQQLAEMLEGTGTEAMSLTGFARFGCPGFTTPEHDPKEDNAASLSLFFPDSAIWSGHPRYR